MALSDIPKSFPPIAGNPVVGWKDLNVAIGPVVESLASLHEPAWWTGVRTASRGSQQEFQVKLHTQDETLAFWRQSAGEWVQFPWPIPAGAARHLNLRMTVTPIDGPDDLVYSVRTSFHECPQMPTDDRYLFFDEAGEVQFYWNGRRKAWGSRDSGAEPQWRNIHLLVPPSPMLRGWNDNRIFCIHEWSERVPVNQPDGR